MISNELGPLTEKLDYHQKAGAAQEKKRKEYVFQRQVNEKPSIVPGCPVEAAQHDLKTSTAACTSAWIRPADN